MRIGIALATLAVTAGMAAAEGPGSGNRTETRNEKLAFGAKLWVANRNGAIKVTGWDKEEVALTAQIRDTEKRKIDLVVTRQGNDLNIEAQFQQPVVVFSFGLSPSPRCEMTLSVPRKLLAYFRTTNGAVAVTNLEGYARCETTNGDITVKEIKGEVMAETTNGALDAYGLKARIKGGSTNGHIHVEDVEGGIDLETTNGPIVARNLDGWGEGIRLESTNGGIEVVLGRATGEIKAENSNGTIDIRVNGAQVVESSKHSARVKVSGREQKIVLETTNGGITVR
jgi:DUF4097 and DUF4098 domain-containing protein YvlB